MSDLDIFLPGRLPGLNSVLAKNRANRYAGASQKKQLTESLTWQIHALNPPALHGRHCFAFIWRERNRRRDPDNIASAAKFVFDALQDAGVIKNDGWRQIASIEHQFVLDKDSVGVRVIAEKER